MTDFDGDNHTISKKDYITVDIRIPDMIPVADFIANATSVRRGQYVQFTFTGLSDNIPNEFLWNFGDGSTSTKMNPKHKYNEIGEYSVRLKVTDKEGDIDILTKENYIFVYSPEPEPFFPSYNIFIIIGIVFIISLVIYGINKKKFKFF